MNSLSNQEWLDQVYDKLLVKMKAECDRVGSMIPCTPKDGRYEDLDAAGGISGWTNGFWPGMLWQMYEATGDESYKAAAQKIDERLEEALQEFETLGHDVGFMYIPSSVANYRKTGDKCAYRRALHAATILAGRYNPTGRFIRAWNHRISVLDIRDDVSGLIIIDCMINLPLLYWASKETGDSRFAQIAVNHAKTAQQYIVRDDGSTNHMADFDSATGEFLSNPGGQGYGVGSCWSRGLSWAIYGFALSYRYTGDESFLATAKKCAHYAIASLAVNDWLPLVDYRAPEEPVKYDSTAGMATACGLLEIAEHVGDLEKKLYIEAAFRILRACDAKFNNWNPDEDAIVGYGTMFYHDDYNMGTHVPIIYGDYYLVEAILRLKGKALQIW